MIVKTAQKKEIYPFCTLLILDGWGDAPYSKYNAVKIAKTPHLDYLYNHSYNTLLDASGEAVGLPKGTIGNSEVGHLNIGAGRVVLQEVLRINNEIQNGKFFHNKVLLDAISHAKEHNTAIHLIGLISDALVHSSIDHLCALLKMCADNDVKDVFIHAITDGRDTEPDSSYRYINKIQEHIKLYKTGTIATVLGRYYAMDRDQRWDRIEKAYKCLIARENDTKYEQSALDGIRKSYNNELTDEFIIPFRVRVDSNDPMKGLIKENDSVIFFNFREDRARQLTSAFVDESFHEFGKEQLPTHFVCMTEYEKGLGKYIAYAKDTVHSPISEVIASLDKFQFKIAETEKYAHVTYFFNGGREVEFPLEDQVLIPSLKIPTYDLKPFMRVFDITDELTARINQNKYKLLTANFANADMVGHTGNLHATIKACEYIDECIEKVAEAVFANNGILVITADHGNAEVKYNVEMNEIATAHTTSPVPFIFATKDTLTKEKIGHGRLADIAPTILNGLGLHRSYEMSGNDLLG